MHYPSKCMINVNNILPRLRLYLLESFINPKNNFNRNRIYILYDIDLFFQIKFAFLI